MSIFATKPIVEIRGKVPFHKLYIDGRCEFDEFWDRIKSDGTYKGELIKIQAIMQQLAELQLLPHAKNNDIIVGKEKIGREIKTRNLRVYYFHDPGLGHLVVTGGKETNQGSDIKHLKKIKEAYLNSKTFKEKRPC
jgi:hypothetical protein